MRADRRRTKKLTVAFHFLFANQAAWRCDKCRSQGLDRKRRCGWREAETAGDSGALVVWARKGVAVSACPKSVITGDSLALLEEFQARRAFGDFSSVGDMPARSVDAFQMLEQLLVKERSDES
jgi:hypothetical protein